MKCFLLFTTLIVLGSFAGAEGSPPSLEIVEPPTHGLTLEHCQEPDSAALSTVLSPSEIAQLRPFCLVLRNLSGKNIIGLTVRWTIRDRSGNSEIMDYRTDSLFLVQQPVLVANSSLLVVPGVLLPESYSGFTGYGPGNLRNVLAKVQNSESVGVYLDAVIFDDRQVIGPDRSQTIEQIKARKVAAKLVADAVSDVISKGADASEILQALAAVRADRLDHVGNWKSRIAQRLLHSKNLDKDLANLRNLPEPAFRR